VFSWDARKALSNFKKHRVSFEEPESIFSDPWALEWEDVEHSDLEYRYQRLGVSKIGRILVVAYAPWRSEDGKEIIRIISARRANRREREAYP
jgi:uncharacterized DUF497 family protein